MHTSLRAVHEACCGEIPTDSKLPEQSFDRFLQGPELVLEDVPNDLHIHSEVLMDEDVAKPANTLPLDLRSPGAGVLRNLLDGLADNFQISN